MFVVWPIIGYFICRHELFQTILDLIEDSFYFLHLSDSFCDFFLRRFKVRIIIIVEVPVYLSYVLFTILSVVKMIFNLYLIAIIFFFLNNCNAIVLEGLVHKCICNVFKYWNLFYTSEKICRVLYKNRGVLGFSTFPQKNIYFHPKKCNIYVIIAVHPYN